MDARSTYRQLKEACQDFENWQIEALANVVWLWRKNDQELDWRSDTWLKERFGVEGAKG